MEEFGGGIDDDYLTWPVITRYHVWGM